MAHLRHGHSFRAWSDNLYCTAALHQECAALDSNRLRAGACWYAKRRDGTLVTADDVAVSATRGRTASEHQWDPDAWFHNRTRGSADAASQHQHKQGSACAQRDAADEHRHRGYCHHDAAAAAACMLNRSVLIAGDSTTRDTFYTFAAETGLGDLAFTKGTFNPRWAGDRAGRWGSDASGACRGAVIRHGGCHRMVARGRSRLAFQFLTAQSVQGDLDDMEALSAGEAFDDAFVQCPVYEFFKPDAYNYTLGKGERARRSNETLGPGHLHDIGAWCRTYVDRVAELGRRRGVRTRIFMLGTVPLPGWTRALGGSDVESRIFRSIEQGLGLSCIPTEADPRAYHVVSKGTPVVTAIDRYGTVGIRRIDLIHPFPNAQYAVVQLMLNHMCSHPLRGR